MTNEIISAEWLFCGLAIPYLYEFHAQKAGQTINDPLKGEDVFSKIDSDPISRKAFDHFLVILGTCLAHLSAAFLPDDGVYLCGSILSSTIEHVKKDISNPESSKLINAFINNRCAGAYLKTIPIYFTPEQDLGLKGCWNYLQLLKRS